MNKFGKRIRELRTAKGYSLRQLAPLVGVGFTYLSKVENGKLDFGDAPSADLIGRLAIALDANSDELLMTAGRVPVAVSDRLKDQPRLFCKLFSYDAKLLERVLDELTTDDDCPVVICKGR